MKRSLVLMFAASVLLAASLRPASAADSVLKGLDLQGCTLFDMGHPTQPVYPGAQQVTAATRYSPEQGYGWIHTGTVGEAGETLVHRPFKYRGRFRAYCIRPVGDLLVDHIFWRGDDKEELVFRADVPDGEYKVAVWTYGMVSAGRFFDYAPFRIRAGVQVKVDVQAEASEKDFWDKVFWREAPDSFEWRPGQNMFEKYMSDAYPLHTFSAPARDGRLEIRFAMPRNGMNLEPRQVNRVLTIRSIFLAPAATGRVFDEAVRRLHGEAEARFNAACRTMPLPREKSVEPLDRFRAQGYLVFRRSVMRRVWPTSMPGPGELVSTIRIVTAQGQREPACFALRALRDIGRVALEPGDLKGPGRATIGKDTIELYWLRYIEQPYSSSGRQKDFAYRPQAEILRPVTPGTRVEAPADLTRGFLVAVKPRQDAAPGEYTGAIHIRPEKGPSTELRLSVRVLPFRLRTYPDDHGRVLYYYGPRWARMFAGDAMYWDRVAKDVAHCQRYAVEPGYQVRWGTDVKQIARFMDVYRRYKWLGPLILGTGDLKMRIVARALAQKKGEQVPRPQQYYAGDIKWVHDLVRLARENHWPPLAFYVSAEAAQKGMPEILATKECIETLHAAVPEADLMEFSISEEEVKIMAETKGMTMLSPNAACFSEENIAMARELGRALWHYGWKRNRFRNGIADWRMGCRGGFAEWYGLPKRAPLNPFDSSGPDCWNDSPPFHGPHGPWGTVREERMAAGRIDFLYLATLEQSLAEARKLKPNTPAVARAQTWLDTLREKIYPHYTYYYRRMRAARKPDVPRDVTERQVTGYGPHEFDQFRKEVAALIAGLEKVKAGG